ncbi:MAG: PKD domain-containing protein [Bacteroidetes bacterium]|nr:PKD domain-containing protein [Bacteroidota bacterium]
MDGEVHNNKGQKLKDKERDETLQEMGYKVLRFTNKEVIADVQKVLTTIRRNFIPPPFSRRGPGGGLTGIFIPYLLFIFFSIANFDSSAQNFGSSGKVFRLGFMNNYSGPTMTVYISSKVATSGTVSMPLVPWSQNFTVPANATVGVQMPAGAENTATEVIGNSGILVTALDSVSVFALNYEAYTSDATLVLPVPALGREYYVTAYKDYFGAPYSGDSEFLIVAAFDNTLIEITPSVATNGGRPAGVPFQITLNAGETYLVKAGGDLTGTHVEGLDNGSGCYNFAIFAGNICTGVECPYCDHLYEQNFPVEAWGMEFVTIPYLTRSADRFRVLSGQNGTSFTINGGPAINLNAGQFYDFSTGTASFISSNNPISVAQYSKGNDCDGANADPFYIMLSPVNQTLLNITFNAFTSAVIQNYYLNVFSETDDISSVVLDGTNISGSFTPVGANPIYSYARLNITQGNHTLTCDSGLIAYIYGYGSYESYGYAAGANTDRKLADFNIYIDGQIYVSDTIPICPGDSIAFKGYSDDTTIISWEWLLGDSTYATGDSIIHVYDSLKTYTVQLIVQRMFDCSKDTITKLFSVKGPFVNATPDTSMCSGTVLILSATAYANQYIWSTGDTTPDINVSPPTSTYYTVRGITPCPGEEDTVFVLVREVNADFTITRVCPGDTTQFINQSSVVNDTIIDWSWDFDDGTPLDTARNPSHFYNVAPAVYYALLTIQSSDGGCVDTVYRPVIFQAQPQVSFGFTNTCFSDSTRFTDSSSIAQGGVTSWTWNFGDATPASTVQDPSHLYGDTGSYTVSLVVVSDSGCTDSITDVVPVYPLPVADFITANVCRYDPALFTDLSSVPSGVISLWNWSFGDGNTSNLQNPSNLYATADTFTVALGVITDKNCMDLKLDTIIIHPIPVADFNGNGVCDYDTTYFTDLSGVSSGNVITWSWDFDDGNLSTAQNPVNYYGNYGTYDVDLIVMSDSGCYDTTVKQIRVYPSPVPAFTTQNVCDYLSAVFTDGSGIPIGNNYQWDWAFGDGFTGSGQTTSHLYALYGTYTIKLTVTSDSGCVDSTFRPIIIHPSPVSDFSTANVCLYDPALFTNNSTIPAGSIPVSFWDFGDSSGILPGWNQVHSYSAFGIYPVELFIASDSGCVDSVTKIVVIHPLPVADFVAPNVCAYDSVLFNNGSTVPAGTIFINIWDFGDLTGSTLKNPWHFYPGYGFYNVELFVQTDSGCVDSVTKPVIIHPVPVADFQTNNVCIYNTAQFTDLSVIAAGSVAGWNWDFGDLATSTIQNPTHDYSPAGSYNVLLVVTSDSNCTDSVIKPIVIHPAPVADFTFDSVCLNLPTSFTDLSTVDSGQIILWAWDFGDATTGTIQNPVHLYNPDGSYPVELIVTTDSNCTDTANKTIIVYPLPVAGFTFGTICELDVATFTDNSTGNPVKWQWDFGDFTGTSILQNPQYIFGSEGTYNVSLTVTNIFNCTDDEILPVPVYARPDISFTANYYEGCEPLDVQFANTTTVVGGTVTGQIWDFGDINSPDNSSNATNPDHTFINSGYYTITLDVVSDKGCRSIAVFKDTIKVWSNPVAGFIFTPDPANILMPQIHFTDLSTPVIQWEWDFDDGNTSVEQNPVHFYEDTGVYIVILKVTNARGCTDTAMRPVDINPEFILFIPNAFTPGKIDGINDNFTPVGMGVDEFHMYIYDRWGDEIFHTDDITKGWDGKANKGGNLAQQDVYVYYIYIKDVNKQEHEFVGHVTLVK